MSWQNIEGHDEVVAAFRQALERGRLAHAYLFVGPSGIGKRLFAQTLARGLLCENRAETALDPCGHCRGCVQVKAGSHPDLIALGRDTDEHDLPIETIRRAIHDLGFKPDRGRYKIAIVDDADDMNQYAANCFLKCLEEPPPRSLLLLVGTSADRQLPTIRSRCQIVRFQPLATALVAQVLLDSGVVGESEEAAQLASMSHGSLARAIALAEPELRQFRTDLRHALAHPRVDSVSLSERMTSLVEAAGAESVEKRTRAKLLLEMATDFLESALRASTGIPAKLSDSADREAIAAFAGCRSPETIARLIERSVEADYQIDRKASVPLVIEAWADEMANC